MQAQPEPVGYAAARQSADALEYLLNAPLPELMREAAQLRDRAYGLNVSYSSKVFIPLTRLCRNVCSYCTFAKSPAALAGAYLSPEEVLEIARRGQAAGCTEALFTLGDKPELRYDAARRALAELGHTSTIDYLIAMCDRVLRETGLLPHVNAGVVTREEMVALREVSASQGLMLESASDRLGVRGGVHFGCPDKVPAVRLANIQWAGELSIPFTTGILIGIGETRRERLDALLQVKELADRYGHIQEVIIQNFRAKPDTRSAGCAEPDLEELLWTVASARLILGSEISLQVPPNLTPSEYDAVIGGGINDWGGVSPVTIDHVNPEAPWPHMEELHARTAAMGKFLLPRLPVYPRYALDGDRWLAPSAAVRVRHLSDATGFVRESSWAPGIAVEPSYRTFASPGVDPDLRQCVARAAAGQRLNEEAVVRLFAARGADFDYVCRAADNLRREVCGDVVRYVVNRNINYTNICGFHCRFCAFSKGKTHEALRGAPYDLDLGEIVRRAREAWDRGATEVCLQGGIHPSYTGETYLGICRAIKEALPGMHIHAFSPLEVSQGAATLNLEVATFLRMLRDAGLSSLPGTAAEVLDDEVRQIICPDKLSTAQWLAVVGAAHRVGLKTTATIMFGHVDQPVHWARHLLAIRDLQAETGGFTEFVPLPFVHMEAPIFLRGGARMGPTFRETVLMHAVARLALHPVIPNIQTSWVKLGPAGVTACLNAGANDMGGTLMNESISRAAGAQHDQEFPPASMEELIRSCGRTPLQRLTSYAPAPDERRQASFGAAGLQPIQLTPLRKSAKRART